MEENRSRNAPTSPALDAPWYYALSLHFSSSESGKFGPHRHENSPVSPLAFSKSTAKRTCFHGDVGRFSRTLSSKSAGRVRSTKVRRVPVRSECCGFGFLPNRRFCDFNIQIPKVSLFRFIWKFSTKTDAYISPRWRPILFRPETFLEVP